MTKCIQAVWHGMGNIYLTAVVLLSMVLDLTWGFFNLRNRAHIFKPMNELGLYEWMTTYGQSHIQRTAWFFILLILLTIMCVNTFVCTTDRMIELIRNRSLFTDRTRYVLRFSPHIMHYALILLLSGFLTCYLGSTVHPSMVLISDQPVQIPGTRITLTLNSQDIVFYEGDRLSYMQDRAIDVRAVLQLNDSDQSTKTATITLNKPTWFKGYGIYMKNFAPRSRAGLGRKPFIHVSVKKDPGVILYFTGMAFFVIGLIMYLFQQFNFKKQA